MAAASGADVDDASRQSLGRTLLIADAARLMGVSRRTVYYRLRDGQLESIKTRGGSRRIVVHSLEWLRQQGIRKNAAVRGRDGCDASMVTDSEPEP